MGSQDLQPTVLPTLNNGKESPGQILSGQLTGGAN